MAEEKTLVDSEKYLKSGAHIGTRFISGDMSRYIYKVRKDGLKVLDIATVDERIGLAAKFLSAFEPGKLVVISRKLYGHTAVKAFAEAVGGKALTGRFVPGTFTNPNARRFIEPKAVIVTEPESDYQAIREASITKLPTVALASTNNSLKNIDLVIPVNNKGRMSLALVYWLLARELLKLNGTIKDYSEFKKEVTDFEYKMREGETAEEGGERRQRKMFGDRGGYGRKGSGGRGRGRRKR